MPMPMPMPMAMSSRWFRDLFFFLGDGTDSLRRQVVMFARAQQEQPEEVRYWDSCASPTAPRRCPLCLPSKSFSSPPRASVSPSQHLFYRLLAPLLSQTHHHPHHRHPIIAPRDVPQVAVRLARAAVEGAANLLTYQAARDYVHEVSPYFNGLRDLQAM
jgi:hypothetical protein